MIHCFSPSTTWYFRPVREDLGHHPHGGRLAVGRVRAGAGFGQVEGGELPAHDGQIFPFLTGVGADHHRRGADALGGADGHGERGVHAGAFLRDGQVGLVRVPLALVFLRDEDAEEAQLLQLFQQFHRDLEVLLELLGVGLDALEEGARGGADVLLTLIDVRREEEARDVEPDQGLAGVELADGLLLIVEAAPLGELFRHVGRRREVLHLAAQREALQPVDHVGKSLSADVPHEAAGLHREAHAGDQRDVDVLGRLRHAFAEDARALVGHQEQKPLLDFLVRDQRLGAPAQPAGLARLRQAGAESGAERRVERFGVLSLQPGGDRRLRA
jgi:hypothetical protein